MSVHKGLLRVSVPLAPVLYLGKVSYKRDIPRSAWLQRWKHREHRSLFPGKIVCFPMSGVEERSLNEWMVGWLDGWKDGWMGK